MAKYEKLTLPTPNITYANKNQPITYTEFSDVISGIENKINSWGNNSFGNLDHMNVRRLYTNYCNIQSEDGETIIDGPVLKMYGDDTTHVRLFAGYASSTNNFVLALNSSDGAPEFYVSGGQAYFAGNIQTAKDAYVGNNIYLGQLASTEIKKIVYNGQVETGIFIDSLGSPPVGYYISANTLDVEAALSIFEGDIRTDGKIDSSGSIECSSGFGCNGADPQGKYAVGVALSTTPTSSTDLADAMSSDVAKTRELVNQIRAALVANGICV